MSATVSTPRARAPVAEPATAEALTLEQVRSRFEALAKYPHVAVAVSGGPDSLALMHLLADWREKRGGMPALTVLTVDHGLRPDSDKEALAVRRAAASRGLPHAVLIWAEPKPETGLQAAARIARYNLLAQFCHAHGIPALVTAHHLDDQAETLLMRLKRGSGLAGLAAIAPESLWAGIAVHRPLLDFPKARLIATLAARGIGWAEDPSNADLQFERVRLRAQKQALEALGFTPEALARSARRLQRARAAIERLVDAFLRAHSQTSAAGFSLLEHAALMEAAEEVALGALARLLLAIGGGLEPPRLAKLEALLEALKEEPSKVHTLSGCKLQPLKDKIGVFREARRAGLPELVLAPGESALWDNRFKVELAADAPAPVTVKALGVDAWRDLRHQSEAAEALPAAAGAPLVSCWCGTELAAVPYLGLYGPGFDGERPKFTAKFVNARLAGAAKC